MPQMTVIEHCYEFLDKYIPQWFATGTRDPLFIFFSGPQGSGKSYTSKIIYEHLLKKYSGEGEGNVGKKTIAYVSIDDFYLTHRDQLALNEQYPRNKLLQGRGMPGTHDMSLLNDCLNAIQQRRGNNKDQDKLILPQYDKSKYNGEGDRSENNLVMDAPVDIFILEGWFIGFEPIMKTFEENDLLKGDMADVNAKLFMYSDLMWNNPEINSLAIVFAADNIDNIYEWRKQQEHASIAKNGSGMTDEQVKAFIDRYYPSYQLYFENLVRGEKLGSVATLTLGLDINRRVYSSKVRCIE
ncbi:putative ATP-dependent kinase NDAI_0D02280 [Naumovozyma dairenensis CBS 421]|uniref:Phosphoribulokinase/uridine kinase domain-containing protein n=1 Tax=Naumovozyma dairenensis (strain ATCC 10597 / BCRC 20456 / CBS 421 / NBRC 0211 / NRRL Y-12639) TaxID=1071378 RepID=G0W9T1_NAUDC|nr:hypothetical protein NDAI_0D02280 [Naumovozyma dairenensis CBS 421]CCD24542.1 hypothetical protein NDAI_0D02280 [Naumovozyma dairenensis CBS 421]